MKKNIAQWAVAAVAAVASIAFTSCAYDPFHTSVGGSYITGSGYGGGYGSSYGGNHRYGSSSYNTSLFISTGNPRWGYDPNSYCYYDYNRRAYYDPYLRGYYPVGYRPPVVYGVPHPHGWRPGRRHIAPPGSVSYVSVSNYRNRESAYRNSDFGWAKQVRQQPVSHGHVYGSRPSRNHSYEHSEGSYGGFSAQSSSRISESRPPRREETGSRYHAPITSSWHHGNAAQRPQLGIPRERSTPPLEESQVPPQPRGEGESSHQSPSGEDHRIRGYR